MEQDEDHTNHHSSTSLDPPHPIPRCGGGLKASRVAVACGWLLPSKDKKFGGRFSPYYMMAHEREFSCGDKNWHHNL